MTGKDDNAAGTPKITARGKRVRDYGAPEPRPSRKVAIDEVLRTLQDLVSNELNLEPPKRPNRNKLRDEPTTPPAGPEKEIAAPPTAVTLDAEADTFPLDESAIEEIELSTPAPVSKPATPAKPIPPEGLQQELPHLEPDAFTPATPEPAKKTSPAIAAPDAEPIDTELPELEIGTSPAPASKSATISKAQDTEPVDTELPELEISTTFDTAPTPAAATPADEHNHTPTDIPVLSDVVDETEDTETVSRIADEPVQSLAGLHPLPPAADARKLAIQAAAKLNVELRKAGKPVLSSDVIARLAHALEEALAKAGTNRENGPSK